jgi:hypothetical protein
MNLEERVSKKSQINRVKISTTVSEEINNFLEKAANESKHATKELLIEIAVEDFLEKYQMPIENINEYSKELFSADEELFPSDE